MIRNSRNPYIPFGTTDSFGATNYSEFVALRKARSAAKKKYDAMVNKKHEAHRAARKRIRELKQSNHAMRHTTERKLLHEEMSKLSVFEQLKRIANDDMHLPNFYSTITSMLAGESVIDALDFDIKIKLAEKLIGRQRGPWRIFKRRLLGSLGKTWTDVHRTPPFIWKKD